MDRVYRSYVVILLGYDACVDFIILDIINFNAILGMDWIYPYHIIFD